MLKGGQSSLQIYETIAYRRNNETCNIQERENN